VKRWAIFLLALGIIRLSVESRQRMEITLNLVWAVLAIVSFSLWMLVESRTGIQKRLPVIALLMILVILFPVISVTDDLWSIQNPAETDTCQRRNHLVPCPHSIFLAFSPLPEPGFAGLTFGFEHFALPFSQSIPALRVAALHGIENRPPPTL
jgi:hypothetical protein